MIGYAVEQVTYGDLDEQLVWLTKHYGVATSDTWYLDFDFDLRNLWMTEKIATAYILRWR